MSKLTVVCWKWQAAPGYRSTFTSTHVNTLRAMVARHYAKPHDFVCLTDDAKGIDGDIRVVPLWNDYHELRGPNGVNCYRRLRAFSAEAADIIGPRFVSLDLDCVITADVAPLWDRPEDFVIWGDTARGTPYNGSMFLLTAGTRRKVWEQFNPHHSPALARNLGYIGSDQAWIGACLGPHERKWSKADGVYSFRNEIQRHSRAGLPGNARIVMFHGRFDPWMPAVQAWHPWIKQHWRMNGIA
jgi:hypothetical protein